MRQSLDGKRVLVTGAGGWLGGEVASRLVDEGAVVTALLRRPGFVLANDHRIASVAVSLLGDISAPRLGWTDENWRAEARRQDLVVHCAALTKFDADPALAHAVNVIGTSTMVEFAAEGGAGLIHVSTAYVNGTRDGHVSETSPVGSGFNNVYEQTKAAAEAVVAAASVPAAIVRPSIVLGDYRTGGVRQFGAFYVLLKMLAEGKVKHMPAEPWATLDLVPIDHVVDGIVAIGRLFDRAVGQTYHLTASSPTPLSAFAETLSQFPGLSIPAFVPPRYFEPPPGLAFARLLKPYAPYFRHNPRFCDDNFLRLTGMGCDPLEFGWWERLVSFAISAKFICPASLGGRNGMASEAAIPSSAGSR